MTSTLLGVWSWSVGESVSAVERAQGSWRYKFYASYDLPSQINKLQPLVDAFAHRFNHRKPHDALDRQTPAEYRKTRSRRDPAASHMS